MAPEQLRGGPVDARADVYAVGVLLFTLLTGRRPFEGEDLLELERAHLETPPPRPGALAPVPADLERLVLRCLEKAPAQRFADAGELLAALRALAPRPANTVARSALLTYFELEVHAPDAEEATAAALDVVESEHLLAGALVPLKTGNSLLAVQLVRPGPVKSQAADVLAVAEAQATRFFRPGVVLLAWVHLAEVELRRAGQSFEVVGGAGLEVSEWARGAAQARVTPTPAVRAVME
jgi:serine/threonine-protein kinase